VQGGQQLQWLSRGNSMEEAEPSPHWCGESWQPRTVGPQPRSLGVRRRWSCRRLRTGMGSPGRYLARASL